MASDWLQSLQPDGLSCGARVLASTYAAFSRRQTRLAAAPWAFSIKEIKKKPAKLRTRPMAIEWQSGTAMPGPESPKLCECRAVQRSLTRTTYLPTTCALSFSLSLQK